MSKQNEMQQDTADAFCALKKRKALVVIGTGGGKTRAVMLVIQKLQPKRVLFLSESTLGRDITMPAEMRKWGLEDYIPKTEFVTYQLAYKWKKKDKPLNNYLVIADEVDFAMTAQYGKFFKEYADIDTFAMTGFVPEHKYEEFKQYLPLLINIDTTKLQDRKIVNKTRLIFVQYCLSKIKDIPITYKRGNEAKTFFQSENGSYEYFMKQERKYRAKLAEAEREDDEKAISSCEYMLSTHIPRKRAEFLFNLNSSADIVHRLKKEILTTPENKVMIFSERTAQADKMSKHTYHGKNKKSMNDKVFDDFNNGKIREMAVCSKINRGANMVGLNYSIYESFKNDVTAATQRNGRMLRLVQEDTGTNYVLLPYYITEIIEIVENKDGTKTEEKKNVIKPTRAVAWAREMFSALNLTNIEQELVDFCGLNIGKIT